MLNTRKVILYIATSVDGYIAQPNNDLSFLKKVEKEGLDYGYTEFYKSIDTVIIGRKTYEWVVKEVGFFPHTEKETYVITHAQKEPEGGVCFYSGSLKELVENLKEKPGKNIYCDGGAHLVHSLLEENLIDEFILSVVPVFLGNGIQLFKNGRPSMDLTLVSTQNYETGLVQLHYKK